MPYVSKITAEQAVAIREDVRPARVVAAEYGLAKTTVYQIRWGESWKRAGGPRRRKERPKPHTVLAIRADRRRAEDVAQQHGVSVGTVRRIWRGESWSGVS